MVMMSFFSYSFSQNTIYESTKNNQCSWNEQTQQKDLCREVLISVQLEIDRAQNRIFITTGGNTSVFKIEEEITVNNPISEFKLISAEGNLWNMSIDLTNHTIWLDMENSQFTDSISYIILN